MNLEELAQDELINLAIEHNVPLPDFRINNRFKRVIGRYEPMKNLIQLASPDYLEGWVKRSGYEPADAWVVVRDVVRHEFAHHLEWVKYGTVSHSARWRAYARAVGAHPRASAGVKERVVFSRAFSRMNGGE